MGSGNMGLSLGFDTENDPGVNGLVSLTSVAPSVSRAYSALGCGRMSTREAPQARALGRHARLPAGSRRAAFGTHQDAPMGPGRQAGPHKSGDEVGSGRAVVPTHPGRQGSHGGIVQVEGTAVRGVGVERA